MKMFETKRKLFRNAIKIYRREGRKRRWGSGIKKKGEERTSFYTPGV